MARRTGKATVGVFGAGSMGGGMLRLFSEKGDHVVGYDPDQSLFDPIKQDFERSKSLDPARLKLVDSVDAFVGAFDPDHSRVIVFSLPHGSTGDAVVESLLPKLDEGDLIIDAGNEHHRTIEARQARCAAKGVHMLGCGVSGGYQAARFGPSMSPGGTREAYELAKPFLEKWAAKDAQGNACERYIGPGGAGSFVKTVHNGIEQGLLSAICEVHSLLRRTYGLSNRRISDIFEAWNRDGPLRSNFLLGLGVDVLRFTEGDGIRNSDGIVDDVKDKVVQDTDDTEGTGVWTAEALAHYHVSGDTIAAAHFLRLISAPEGERQRIVKMLGVPQPAEKVALEGEEETIQRIGDALYAAMLASFVQGLNLIARYAKRENVRINLVDCLAIWRAGCIIQSDAIADFLLPACEAADKDRSDQLLLDERVASELGRRCAALKAVVLQATENDAVVSSLSASLSWLKAWGNERLPTSFQESEMDAFGHHNYDLRSEDAPDAVKGSHHTEFRPPARDE